ncbi:MAG: indolepyruvate ferredoxin oxidoreductase subunit alpha [Treponema sp.]|jgi:indolepyruvate ferredoxin oxidoreductase alpha subunit|nr:indolepyruvate ferredoxin oxidoreductase subunit alpha [Treponema sp.]
MAEAFALLGDEAVALAALHAGISAAYGYPGTPSTEILERIIAECEKDGNGGADARDRPKAAWCVNEKTALEAALGTSFAGRRVLVTMKHVGLNVAADPFVNGALLEIKGGLVIAAADDPGMHSSQNEQDSRFYAAFAMIPCLEPRGQQEAYDMTREAFDVSERFHVPVMLRLVTRLSHARSTVIPAPPRGRNPLSKAGDRTRWMLLPVYARRNYACLVEKQKDMEAWSASHPANKTEGQGAAEYADGAHDLAVITSGLGGNYYDENLPDFAALRGGAPPRLHIGIYPLPAEKIRRFCEGKKRVLVIEEGQPFMEERLRGILPHKVTITGRLDGGMIPRTGELDPDNIRAALGLLPRAAALEKIPELPNLPARPPQLCQGCPHADSYETIKKVITELDGNPGHPSVAVNSDIGCYSLGASPPWSVPESIVCMGASVGMARGAAEAGIPYAVAVIGDSTFIHSGIPGLIDAVNAGTPMTVVIFDNSTVAMTGCQETAVPSAKLRELVLGLGVRPERLVELDAKRQLIDENAARLRAEIEYRGLSVVIFKRECLEAARRRKKAGRKIEEAPEERPCERAEKTLQ